MDSTTRYTIWFYDSINRGLLNITAHILASSSSIPEPTAHITTLMLLVIFRVLQRASGRATWYLPCCPSRFRGSVLRTKRLHLSLFSTILGLDFTFLSFWNFLRLIITSIYPCVQLFWGLLFFSDGVATIHVVHPYSVPINALGGQGGLPNRWSVVQCYPRLRHRFSKTDNGKTWLRGMSHGLSGKLWSVAELHQNESTSSWLPQIDLNYGDGNHKPMP